LNYYTWENEEKVVEKTEVRHPKAIFNKRKTKEIMNDAVLARFPSRGYQATEANHSSLPSFRIKTTSMVII
jgi:hypothetical protein